MTLIAMDTSWMNINVPLKNDRIWSLTSTEVVPRTGPRVLFRCSGFPCSKNSSLGIAWPSNIGDSLYDFHNHQLGFWVFRTFWPLVCQILVFVWCQAEYSGTGMVRCGAHVHPDAGLLKPRVVHQPDIYRTPYVILMGLSENLQGSIVFTWCSFVVFNLHFFVPCFARKVNGRKGNAQNRYLSLSRLWPAVNAVWGTVCTCNGNPASKDSEHRSMKMCGHTQRLKVKMACPDEKAGKAWNVNTGWWFGTFLFSIQLGMSSSQLTLTLSFFWWVGGVGLNHQPGTYSFQAVYEDILFRACEA